MNPKNQPTGTPPAEVEVSVEQLRDLLRDQHPDLSSLSIDPMDAGWDNMMFRLGTSLTVRMPRRKASAIPLINEQNWLPVLAPKLPLPVPVPVRIGCAGRSYPWSWSILPWFDGSSADQAPPDPTQAVQLATFLKALHTPASADAPIHPGRSIPIQQRASFIQERLDRLRVKTTLISAAVEEALRNGLQAQPSTEKRWLHGDLHARNVLVHHGIISAIIDWGDITSGDVAIDLASIWMLFDSAKARREALDCYSATPEETSRAKAWAVFFGSVLLETGLIDHAPHAAMGATTLRRITEGDG
jgi:aminoglycoside phosphotransferase (APT) family kinase protein